VCGITGFIDAAGGIAPVNVSDVISRMTGSLAHRGPDGSGTWISADRAVAFGHRRLSIVDLSERGAQPALAREGGHALVFNGEIYNFREVARELGVADEIHGDTELMLRAFQRWGCREAVPHFAGMFAFAYFDQGANEVWLGRDRFGEKPLYYSLRGEQLVFASELKALRGFPGLPWEIDPISVERFLRFGFVPGPATIYAGVSKLPPGQLLRIRLGQSGLRHEFFPYWSLGEVATRGLANRGAGTHFVERGRELLRGLVNEYAQADVPVGTFLSGGIDSSLITALLKEGRAGKLSTFTIGFSQADFDEAPAARAVARHLGTEHHEAYVSAEDALGVIEQLPEIYDEPFADSSQIPTFLVSRLAQGQVKVALSGDGGDEIFAGYNRHFLGSTAWKYLAPLPAALRGLIAGALARMPAHVRGSALRGAYRLVGKSAPLHAADKIDKLFSCLAARDLEALYLDLVSIEKNPARFLAGGAIAAGATLAAECGSRDPLFVMQYLDSVFYLPGDILTKVDRASMAVGLEVRCPFLDHRLTDFAWSLPNHWRVSGGRGKVLLRELLASYVPESLWNRPKSGFAIPMETWLRGPLRPWAEDLLSGTAAEGTLNMAEVRREWASFVAGRGEAKYSLWNLLILLQWLEHGASAVFYRPKREVIGGAGKI